MKKRITYLLIVLFIGTISLYKIHSITHAESNKMENNNTGTNIKTATFSGGCFWCSESDFEKVKGVISVISGFTGGTEDNPSYEDVSYGRTSHIEGIQVRYDADKVTYTELLEVFWKHIDPTDPGGQFVDRGPQYRTAIFYHSDDQKQQAVESKKRLENTGVFQKAIATEILPSSAFYNAEDYHQDYYKKNPVRYNLYRYRSGRDQFIKKVWGDKKEIKITDSGSTQFSKPDGETIRKQLSPLEYKVTQENGTEPPFNNPFWDNKKEGIYVDIVTGEPLFSSKDKFKSGTGWPSFTRSINKKNIVEIEDRSLFMVRTEVRSKHGDSHLGHLFPDGPEPTGLRYCINSAALRFIPKDQLKQEGYEEYEDILK